MARPGRLSAFQSRTLSGLDVVSVSVDTGCAWDMQAKDGPRRIPARTFAALVGAGSLVDDGTEGRTRYFRASKDSREWPNRLT